MECLRAERLARQMARARHYIDQQQAPDLSLPQIARHAGLSVSTLQRQFKMEYGQTVIHYLRAHRLRLAHDALTRQHISIGEAAFMAGYRHPSNFVTAFKRAFGVTPGETR